MPRSARQFGDRSIWLATVRPALSAVNHIHHGPSRTASATAAPKVADAPTTSPREPFTRILGGLHAEGPARVPDMPPPTSRGIVQSDLFVFVVERFPGTREIETHPHARPRFGVPMIVG